MRRRSFLRAAALSLASVAFLGVRVPRLPKLEVWGPSPAAEAFHAHVLMPMARRNGKTLAAMTIGAQWCDVDLVWECPDDSGENGDTSASPLRPMDALIYQSFRMRTLG